MMVSSPMMPKAKGNKNGDHDDGRNDGNGRALSPLSRFWGDSNSPPAKEGDSPRNGNRTLIPSPQRRLLFGFDGQGPENVENDRAVSPSKRGRRKCAKKASRERQDAAAKSADAAAAFSELFPERISQRSSATVAARRSILLNPRLSRRPPERSISASSTTSSSSSGTAPPRRGLSIKLAPKSPGRRKKPPPKRPKLSPRKSSDSASVSKQHPFPMSPLHPPRSLPRAANNNNCDNFGDFTLTPTVLYNGSNSGQGGHGNHSNHLLQAPMSAAATGGHSQRTPQYYHQSPHWSGQVRVNPFSPVPEQYLRPPPTSTKSATRGNRKRHYTGRYPGFYNWDSLAGPPTMPVGEIGGPLAPARPSPIRSSRSRSAAATAAIPRLDDGEFDGVSPTDVSDEGAFDAGAGGGKRKTPPQDWRNDDGDVGNKRMRPPKRGRYLSDFEEVQFLGAGSFGSVNACLSRLDGCMYAVKSISPAGVRRGRNTDTTVGIQETSVGGAGGVDYLYGGRRMMSNQCAVPPTPRGSWTLSPLKRRKAVSRFGADELIATDEDCGRDLGALEGSGHWNDGALRRMLREVFALAALCQQDDFRTFHIVRYQQAWLEDDGTLYIQTELCSATLRDEMSGKRVVDGKLVDGIGAGGDGKPANEPSSTAATNSTTPQTMDVFRQLKVLREVLLALELVHQRGMVHLDIKPENIMIKNDLYKLGDFGLANSFTENEGRGDGAAIAPDVEEGDSRYMSRDLLDFRPKDLTKCDIFSLGATMYEVCTGRPLPSCGQEWQDLRNGRPPHPFPSCTMPCLAAVVREMMHPDPKRRPSATELLSRELLGGEGGGGDPPLFGSARKSCSSYRVGPTSRAVLLDRPSRKRSASF